MSAAARIMPLACLVLSAAFRVSAADAGPRPIVLDPWSGGSVLLSEISSADSVLSPPMHGTLEPGASAGEVRYSPRTDFWSVGSDSLVVARQGQVETVLLVAGRYPRVSSTGFEPGTAPWPTVDDEGRLRVEPAAVLDGTRGLRMRSGGLPAHVGFDLPLDNGTGQQGTGTSMKVRLPGADGGGDVGGSFTTIHAAGLNLDEPDVSMALRRTSLTTYELRLALPPGEAIVLPLDAGDHRLGVDLQREEQGLRARLSVDQLVRAELVGRPSGLVAGLEAGESPARRFAFGSIGPHSGRWHLDLDDLVLEAGGALAPRSEPLIQTDFEGEPQGWDLLGWGPQLSPLAALTGKRGALLPLDAGTEGFWFNSRPDALDSATLRVGLRILGASALPAEGLSLLAATGADEPGAGPVLFDLRLAEGVVTPQLVVHAGRESRMVALTQPLQAHVIELQWSAASAQAQDGLLRLWLDGEVAVEMSQLANPGQRLESLRLGVEGAASGAVAVDDIVLWGAGTAAPAKE